MTYKKREESSFGIHFDFHATAGEVVPSVWRPEVYAEMLDAVKPDFVQCDTKGHPGLSSYPTKVGNRASLREDIDILRTMRDLTAERGIALYGHHSGVFDQRAGELHPDWCVVTVEGKVDREHMSVFGPYVDELLIPQLRELAGDYGLNGAWIDGDCWACQVDYSHWAMDAYRAKYDREVPHPGEGGYTGYREFCREGFRAYVRHYVEVMKAEFPAFQITSNWMWSAYMPQKMDTQLEFLSGDYQSTDSVRSARFHGRVLEARGVPWDLMAWGHNARPESWQTRNRTTKELAQYCQEASVVVAMGGCFEFFNIHYGNGGWIQQWPIPIWAKTAAFCRERRACFGGRIRREIGVLLTRDRNEESRSNLYGGAKGAWHLAEWIQLLQDSQYSTKVVFEHQLREDDLQGFEVLVIPACEELSASALAGLARYLEGGGRVLVDGPGAWWFEELGGYTLQRKSKELIFVDEDGSLSGGETRCVTLDISTGAEFGRRYNDNFYGADYKPAGVVNALGRGIVAVLTFGLGEMYADNGTGALRRFTRRVLSEILGFVPAVRVNGSRFVDVTVTEKENKLLVNLVNMAGEHRVPSVRSYDEVPVIGPLTVEFSPELKVGRVRMIPGNTDVQLEEGDDGVKRATIPILGLHCALECERGVC